MKKIRLIDNWRDCWRFTSVQIAALLAVLDAGYEYMPVLKQYLPPQWVTVMALAIIAARIIRQSKLHEGKP